MTPANMRDRDLTVGVLGGMGPEATIDFMSQVLRLTGAAKDQDHLHLIVDQNPGVPNRQQAIRGEGPDAAPELAAMARRLQGAGADFLVMPCNSAHAFESAIREATDIPFVSIVDVCIDGLRQLGADHGGVGVLATDGLLDTGIYQQRLLRSGLQPLLPSPSQQSELMGLIHRVKAGHKECELRMAMRRLADSLVDNGASCILAACTEIPLVLDAAALPVAVLSSTEALAERTVKLARRELPLPPKRE